MVKEAVFKVTGMHCNGCAGNVEKALKALPGVSAVSVVLSSQKATVQFDPAKTSKKEMEKAIQTAGFGLGK